MIFESCKVVEKGEICTCSVVFETHVRGSHRLCYEQNEKATIEDLVTIYG